MAKGSIKGITIEIGGDTSPLEKSLKGVNSHTKDLQSELKSVTALLKMDPGNIVLLQQKQDLLSKSVANTSDKLKILKDAQADVQKQFEAGKINEEQYRAFQRELQATEGQLKKTEAALKQDETAVKGFDQAQGKATHGSKEFADAQNKISSACDKVLVGITAAVAGFSALIAKTVSSADSIQKTADVFGMTAERVQELTYVGAKLDVELETITKAQQLLTKNMYSAKEGADAQSNSFGELGISITESNGELRNSQDVMTEVITALGNMSNETERDAIAQKLLGKSAMELNPLIKAGGDEIAKLTDEARKNGAVMSNEAIAGLDGFGDSVDAMKLSLQGMIGTALIPIIPKLQEISDKFKDVNIKPFTDGIGWVIDHGQGVVIALGSIVAIIGTYKTVLFATNVAQVAHTVALGASKVAHGAAAAATGVATAAQWLFNAALTANPIGLVIVGLTALIATLAALSFAFNKSAREAEKAMQDMIEANRIAGEAEIKQINDTYAAKQAVVDDKISTETKYYYENLDLNRKLYNDEISKGQDILKAKKKNISESLNLLSENYHKSIELIRAEYGVFDLSEKSKTEIVQEESAKKIAALEEQKTAAQDMYNKSITAIRDEYGVFEEKQKSKTQSIQDEYNQKTSLISEISKLSESAAAEEGSAFEKTYLAILDKAKEVHNEKILMYEQEYLASIGLINSDLAAKIKGFQDEIDEINEKTDEENKILKEQSDTKKKLDLQQNIDSAKTDEERLKAVEALQEEITRQNREKLKQQREDDKESLRTKIDEAVTKAKEEKDKLLTELKSKIADEQIEITKDTDFKISEVQRERESAEAAEAAKLEATIKRIADETEAIKTKTADEIAKIQEERIAKETAETAKYTAAKKSMDDESTYLDKWLTDNYTPALDEKLKIANEKEDERHKKIIDNLTAEAAQVKANESAAIAASANTYKINELQLAISGKKDQLSKIVPIFSWDFFKKAQLQNEIDTLTKQLDSLLKSSNSGSGISSYAVGTDYVPHDMLAFIHQGEKIIPASQNISMPKRGSISYSSGNNGSINQNYDLNFEKLVDITFTGDINQDTLPRVEKLLKDIPGMVAKEFNGMLSARGVKNGALIRSF